MNQPAELNQMVAHIDHRLLERVNAAEPGLVEAIFVVSESSPLDDAELLRIMVEEAVDHSGDPPAMVRYFPRANAVVLTGSVRLIQEILKDKNLAVASAVDVASILKFDQ